MHKPTRIVIIGAGITGLATAYDLSQQDTAGKLQIRFLEASDRIGGKIRGEAFADMQTIDVGAEAFQANTPAVQRLCQALHLEQELVAPAARKTRIWAKGRLRPLPDGLSLGVPTQLGSVATSGILSPRGILRAGLDLVLPQTHWQDDPSVAEIVGTRLGQEALNYLVEPLLGGIHSSRAENLSMSAVAPHLARAARSQRSLMLALRAQRHSKQKVVPPQLRSLNGGLTTLVQSLHTALKDVDVSLQNPVQSIVRNTDGTYRILSSQGPDNIADGIVITTPAWSAATILQESIPTVVAELQAIQHASTATIFLAYPRSALANQLNGSGFLVPRADGHLLKACTWVSKKWPSLVGGSNKLILRCSVALIDDQLSDAVLVDRVHQELVAAMGLQQSPVTTYITRWERAFPIYEPGHAMRIARIEKVLADVPGLYLAGAAYGGVGIASCIQTAEQTASRVQLRVSE